MLIQDTSVADVKQITPEFLFDERGFFARTWAEDVFAAHGLQTRVVQRNLSFNREPGTLRGMHFQRAPHAEVKIISCLMGAMYDVALDLRPESPTYRGWFGAELRADTGAMLYVPEGCAHGYLTLEPNTLVEYLVSEFYHPEAAGGVRWDDPAFGIQWPVQPRVMTERDRTYPDFVGSEALRR